MKTRMEKGTFMYMKVSKLNLEQVNWILSSFGVRDTLSDLDKLDHDVPIYIKTGIEGCTLKVRPWVGYSSEGKYGVKVATVTIFIDSARIERSYPNLYLSSGNPTEKVRK